MAKFLDDSGLSYFYTLLKTKFNKVDPATATPAMDGTAATGSSALYAREDHVHPTDTSRAPASHASATQAYGTGSSTRYGHVMLSDATNGTDTAASGGTAATPKAVADALASASSTVQTWAGYSVRHATCTTGMTTAAKAATTDANNYGSVALTLKPGTCVAVTFQYGNSALTPTLNIDGTGAKTIAMGSGSNLVTTGDGQTYNSWAPYETLLFTYDGTYWVNLGSGRALRDAYKLAENAAPKASPALTGTPTAPTASAGTNTTQIATTAFVSTAITNAMTGSASFKGSLGSSTSTATYTQSTLEAASYKAGWYLVVNSAGTYVGHACEVGDMVYCVSDKGSSYSASDFTVVQNELDIITNTEIAAIVV